MTRMWRSNQASGQRTPRAVQALGRDEAACRCRIADGVACGAGGEEAVGVHQVGVDGRIPPVPGRKGLG